MTSGTPASRDRRMATAAETRRFGPGWPVRAAADGADPQAVLPDVLWSGGSFSWYFGAIFSLLWMISVGQSVIAASPTIVSAVAGIALLVLFSIAFLATAPLSWALVLRGRLAVCGGLFLLSFTLVPWLGADITAIWTYVGVAIGMSVLPWRSTWLLIVALAVLALAGEWMQAGRWSDDLLFLPAIVLSISMMMAAFARTIAAVNQLRATQDQMATLAAERERGRVARDIHDILGHSLTVITVKAELAGRLVEVDPRRARVEIAEVEALARGALADVRSTVAGFRGVNVSGELAGARAALTAAGITADLPSSAETVPLDRRELAGWVVREGVTNVIRHSEASRCRVRVGEELVQIDDDGVGPTHTSSSSTGLIGLRERVESAGARLTIGRSDLGGFQLKVTL